MDCQDIDERRGASSPASVAPSPSGGKKVAGGFNPRLLFAGCVFALVLPGAVIILGVCNYLHQADPLTTGTAESRKQWAEFFQTAQRARGVYYLWVSSFEHWFGTPRAAVEAHRLADKYLTPGGPRPSPLEMKHREFRLLADAGDIAGAEQAYRELLEMTQQVGDRHREALALAEQGHFLVNQGQYGEGISTLEQALPALRESDQKTLASVVELYLLAIYGSALGESSAAETFQSGLDKSLNEKRARLQTALAILPRLSFDLVADMSTRLNGREGHAGTKMLLQQLVDSHRSFPARTGGSPLTSISCNTPAGLGNEIPGFSWDRWGVLANVRFARLLIPAANHIKDANWVEALSLLEKLLASDGPVEHPLVRGFVLMPAGLALWHAGHPGTATHRLQEAIACLELNAARLGNVELWQAFMGGLPSLVYPILLEMLVLEGHPGMAFEYSEKARSRALLEATAFERSTAVGREIPALEAQAEQLRAEIRSLDARLRDPRLVERASLQAELDVLRVRHRGLSIRREIANRDYSAASSAETVAPAQVQSWLSPDVTLVSYFVTPTRTHAWLIERDAFGWFSLPPLEGEVSAPLCFSNAARRGARGSEALAGCVEDELQAEHLYQQLLAPLRPYIRHSKLILIPHGPLHYVPFAALKDPATGRYLIEDFTITLAPSASVLQFLRLKESPLTGRALVLGDPNPADASLSDLAGSRHEAEEVARMLATEPLLGAQASETAVVAFGKHFDILHLAAHGVYLPASSQFSRIALSPLPGDDGNLEVHEIYSKLNLTGVNLVVLSACETALGERSGGDEIVGLTRAFLYAGATGVISTLWQVDDAASAELMIDFYRRLKAGEAVAEALRGAQLALARQDRYAAPFYWAGYTLTGDPRARWETRGRVGGRKKREGPRS